jgi:hypothetical protein
MITDKGLSVREAAVRLRVGKSALYAALRGEGDRQRAEQARRLDRMASRDAHHHVECPASANAGEIGTDRFEGRCSSIV